LGAGLDEPASAAEVSASETVLVPVVKKMAHIEKRTVETA
jgi:hypothetical protein